MIAIVKEWHRSQYNLELLSGIRYQVINQNDNVNCNFYAKVVNNIEI